MLITSEHKLTLETICRLTASLFDKKKTCKDSIIH
jgi:hypothetical protein